MANEKLARGLIEKAVEWKGFEGAKVFAEDGSVAYEVCACGVLKERCDKDAGCYAIEDFANYPPGIIFEKPESPE